MITRLARKVFTRHPNTRPATNHPLRSASIQARVDLLNIDVVCEKIMVASLNVPTMK